LPVVRVSAWAHTSNENKEKSVKKRARAHQEQAVPPEALPSIRTKL